MGADFSSVSLATEEKRIHDQLNDPNALSWMIELDGRVIGNIELNSIKETSSTYGVKAGRFSTLIGDKSHWGKRIAPNAKRAVMQWAFGEGGFELIVGKVISENQRSWRSLERLGFELRNTESKELDGTTREWRVYVMAKKHWARLKE
jgi:RimJ/RimL family protein N-acetyltransferase